MNTLTKLCFAVVLSVMIGGPVLAASTCSPPPPCSANEASSWDGGRWRCVSLTGGSASMNPCGAIPHGKITNMGVSETGRRDGNYYTSCFIISISQCVNGAIVSNSFPTCTKSQQNE